MQPIFIANYNKMGGMIQDRKAAWLPDQAFAELFNAYVWRDRIKKREGIELIGRLQRNFENYPFFAPTASPWTFNLNVVTGFVSTTNNANPGKVTTTFPHGLTTGDKVIINGIVGATGYNNTSFTITVVDTTNFTVGVNAAGFGAYVSGGAWISNRSINTSEPHAEITPGSVVIVLAGPIMFTDQGDGTLISATPGASGTINYITGSVTLTFPGSPATATITYSYYPSLPVMGIWQRELAAINDEQTVLFDTKYAYKYSTGSFEEFYPGTTWDGDDFNFFWAANFRGTAAFDRLFFVTNFKDSAGSPIRYTSGGAWTDFAPALDGIGTLLLQARIIIPYYGRLLAFNTYEGATPGAGSNYFNRCRFSQVGNPIDTDAWKVNIPGRGGFIDAPTNEAIVSAAFIKNTLVVFFEKSTWQLRYLGDYGLPFLWERISSDFGAESTFSEVLFDDNILAIGDRAIILSNANTVKRVDDAIPDLVYNIYNEEHGPERVHGIRDYQKEVVFWCYPDALLRRKFPNRVLVYNYRNNTYAIFRDNVTAFGTLQEQDQVTWDSLDTYWDDENVTWDDVQTNNLFPTTVSGNQQGFIHKYGYVTTINPISGSAKAQQSLSITAIDTTVSPNVLTVVNHNLETTDVSLQPGDSDGTVVFLRGSLWSGVNPGLNDQIYGVSRLTVDTIGLYIWDDSDPDPANWGYIQTPIASPAAGTYIGGGSLTIIPRMTIESKDFNPFQDQGMQVKVIYIDFLTDRSDNGAFSVELILNTSLSVTGNVLTGNKESETYLPLPYYIEGSDMAWHRFYATTTGQYVKVVLTYDDVLMNNIDVQQSDFVMNAMALWVRPGGKNVF